MPISRATTANPRYFPGRRGEIRVQREAAMNGSVRILVGTTKGAFVLSGDERQDFKVSGPHCDGWPINHVIGDASGRMWAAGGGKWEGAGVWRSDNGTDWTLTRFAAGERDTWIADNPEEAARFGFVADPPAPFTGEVEAIWSIARNAGTLYAGTKPANLYESHDGGATWQRLAGLADHPSRPGWHPGGAGLVLHTIVPDPGDEKKLWVGISAAGVFATEDGGKTFERRVRRANVPSDHHHIPGLGEADEVGWCVHNLVRAPSNGVDLLYQQNHHGVFRSPDGGRSWVEVSEGLPTTFGFPIAVHPRDAQTIWVVPLNGDSIGRYPPDAAAAVWRSRDGGESWEASRTGLPQSGCFFTVLRQAMAVDRATPAGVYFGTNSGSVFASLDEGDTWSEIARHLPTILSVETITA